MTDPLDSRPSLRRVLSAIATGEALTADQIAIRADIPASRITYSISRLRSLGFDILTRRASGQSPKYQLVVLEPSNELQSELQS